MVTPIYDEELGVDVPFTATKRIKYRRWFRLIFYDKRPIRPFCSERFTAYGILKDMNYP